MNRWDQENILNATALDNLMTGASLGYSGAYYNKELQRVSTDGLWWSSTVNETRYAYDLGIKKGGNYLIPQNHNNAKYYGRSVRCVSNLAYRFGDATQGDPEALIIGARLNQTRASHNQAVTIGTIINSR